MSLHDRVALALGQALLRAIGAETERDEARAERDEARAELAAKPADDKPA